MFLKRIVLIDTNFMDALVDYGQWNFTMNNEL